MLHPVRIFLLSCIALLPVSPVWAQSKITLDEFLNATEVQEAKLSPDGAAAVIATTVPDWDHHRYRSDLWLWKQATGSTVQLTRSGHARSAEWSPDGRYIAYLSDFALPDDKDKDAPAKDGPERVWLIAADGGEAFPLYLEPLEAHAFAWSADGTQIFFSTMLPLTKKADDEHSEQWKDVIRYREQERGDLLLAQPVAEAISRNNQATHAPALAEDALPIPAAARVLSHSDDYIKSIVTAPGGGGEIAFVTDSPSQRLEDPKHNEIYVANTAAENPPRRLTNIQAVESDPAWSPDGSRLYFRVAADAGSLEGPWRDVQGRVYAVEPASAAITRLGPQFDGSFENFTVLADGRVIATGQKGTQQQLYQITPGAVVPLPGLPGTYDGAHAAQHGSELIVLHSTVTEPTQAFLITDISHPDQGRALTHFNEQFAQRAQPEWKPYQWKADDGTLVEGMLIYPPHALRQRPLRMLTLIHGGPADADGNRFGASWYDWANLAASQGWLVFRPNYRGSTGYGDAFMLQIAPHLVSRPGKDILEGVDALVKDGIADPAQLTIGGYSYGGYLTNWLITQTTRFKAAVTGAGAVEHAANWGNDDTGFDDAWYMGGVLPWQNPAIYQSEAAWFQMDKVRTPTHIVGGDADVRVSFLEDVMLERALQQLHIPHELLVFPGEGHSLDNDPWHGYIKLREELLWLETYGGR